ncbi:MAG: BMP family ABC transporter substrate-binding protein [Firmicutes bacterium]|nr:BMP family ABC transporter substrate-binding protein [Bacillota bacterium]
MNIQTARDEYALALRQGQKEYRELIMAGRRTSPAVLDEILPENAGEMVQEVGLVEIPASRIVGTKSAGRTAAFTPQFRPLLDEESEFACKWISLCADHLGDTGIRDPILCYEYLGNFYVQEGNKRVSVLRHFDAPRIPGIVRRILPEASEEPRIKAYYEFLDFFNDSGLYTVQFRRPGDFAKFLSYLGKNKGEKWTEDERKTFSAYFQYFRDAFGTLNTKQADVLPEEALLLWLKLHSFQDLGRMPMSELKKSLAASWEDVLSSGGGSAVEVKTKTEEVPRPNLISRILTPAYDHLNVAFIHQLNPVTSNWVMGHEEGKTHIERVFGDKITVTSYLDTNTTELAESRIAEAVADGAQVIFVTAPILSKATLKAAVTYPKVYFFHCSVDQPYSSIRAYYGRMFEGKFITGAIAGAMADNDRIGYIAAYPIFGEITSINAFALGAQMTNPRAKIQLRWSCLPGSPQADFIREGIRVASNRDVPAQDRMYLDLFNYGTYLLDEQGGLSSLGSPVWVWGRFYEYALRTIFAGGWKHEKDAPARNYWLGMDSGIVDIKLSDKLPDGVRHLAELLRRDLIDGRLDPFCRRITAQDGTRMNDGSRHFTPEELLHMDWLCDNVEGSIPAFDRILPVSQAVVRELGIYRDQIPPEKEGSL